MQPVPNLGISLWMSLDAFLEVSVLILGRSHDSFLSGNVLLYHPCHWLIYPSSRIGSSHPSAALTSMVAVLRIRVTLALNSLWDCMTASTSFRSPVLTTF